MKNIILFSLTLAALLNIWQFLSTQQQRADAFAPAWAMAASQTSSDAAKATPAAAANSSGAKADTASVPAAPAADAAADPVAKAQAELTTAGLKPQFAAAYLNVSTHTGTPWQLLAAVHKTETGQSGDTGVASYAGAVGPMQFMPATFRAWAVDGDGDGQVQITSFNDSVMTAGRYLAAGGADKGDYTDALYHYNHSNAYVSHVLGIARQLGL